MQREHDPRTPEHRILDLVPGNSAVERQNLHALEQTGLDFATHREGDSVVHWATGFATLERKPVRLGLWLSWFEAPDDEGVYGPAQASSINALDGQAQKHSWRMRSPRLRGRQATEGVFTFGMAWRNDFAQGQRMARCWRLFADDEVLVARESYPAFGHAPPIIPASIVLQRFDAQERSWLGKPLLEVALAYGGQSSINPDAAADAFNIHTRSEPESYYGVAAPALRKTDHGPRIDTGVLHLGGYVDAPFPPGAVLRSASHLVYSHLDEEGQRADVQIALPAVSDAAQPGYTPVLASAVRALWRVGPDCLLGAVDLLMDATWRTAPSGQPQTAHIQGWMLDAQGQLAGAMAFLWSSDAGRSWQWLQLDRTGVPYLMDPGSTAQGTAQELLPRMTVSVSPSGTNEYVLHSQAQVPAICFMPCRTDSGFLVMRTGRFIPPSESNAQLPFMIFRVDGTGIRFHGLAPAKPEGTAREQSYRAALELGNRDEIPPYQGFCTRSLIGFQPLPTMTSSLLPYGYGWMLVSADEGMSWRWQRIDARDDLDDGAGICAASFGPLTAVGPEQLAVTRPSGKESALVFSSPKDLDKPWRKVAQLPRIGDLGRSLYWAFADERDGPIPLLEASWEQRLAFAVARKQLNGQATTLDAYAHMPPSIWAFNQPLPIVAVRDDNSIPVAACPGRPWLLNQTIAEV